MGYKHTKPACNTIRQQYKMDVYLFMVMTELYVYTFMFHVSPLINTHPFCTVDVLYCIQVLWCDVIVS